MDLVALDVLAVAFVATFVRSTFGFGEALVAVPLLALTMPVNVAAPLAVLLSITIAAAALVQDWRSAHISAAGWLLAPTFLGIPLGLLLLTRADQSFVEASMAAVIIGFSAFSLFGKNPPKLREDSRPWMLASGFLAGILGGAYGMNGPPLAIYGAARRWSPPQFRATLQGYFLPASIVGMAGYWLAGLWTPGVTHYYGISLISAVPSFLLGRAANRRLRHEDFLKFVHSGLICVGALLLARAAGYA